VKLSSPLNDEGVGRSQAAADLRVLFHRLNNQLGIVLAHAELLEAKAADDVARARAAQVVTSVLEAMATAREIRSKTEPSDA
jgi:pyruvoyl-dependent arginine decarboxylase (PvlArgDC)